MGDSFSFGAGIIRRFFHYCIKHGIVFDAERFVFAVMVNGKIDIADSEIHIWLVELDKLNSGGRRLEYILPDDVLRKAARRRTTELRSKYIAAQASLRIVMARYLGADPADVILNYSAKGKPFLPYSALGFNLSDSGGLAVVAVANKENVGVDIERIRHNFDCLRVARRRFRVEESDFLNTFSGDGLIREFFRLWTRKEAYLKAVGSGISGGLDCRVDEIEGWTVDNFEVGDAFAAAFAVNSPQIIPKLFSLV